MSPTPLERLCTGRILVLGETPFISAPAPVLPAQKQLAKIQKLEDQLAKMKQQARAEENSYTEYRTEKMKKYLNTEADVYATKI